MSKNNSLIIKVDKKLNNYYCNICSEEIKEGEIIGLKCNSKKHIFCYECINDWFNESFSNKMYKYQNIKNMCPMCRRHGGKLPYLNDKYKFNHQIYYNSENNLEQNCGCYIKKSNKICTNIGKKEYNYRCGLHKNKN